MVFVLNEQVSYNDKREIHLVDFDIGTDAKQTASFDNLLIVTINILF